MELKYLKKKTVTLDYYILSYTFVNDWSILSSTYLKLLVHQISLRYKT